MEMRPLKSSREAINIESNNWQKVVDYMSIGRSHLSKNTYEIFHRFVSEMQETLDRTVQKKVDEAITYGAVYVMTEADQNKFSTKGYGFFSIRHNLKRRPLIKVYIPNPDTSSGQFFTEIEVETLYRSLSEDNTSCAIKWNSDNVDLTGAIIFLY